MRNFLITLLIFILMCSCDNNDVSSPDNEVLSGTGSFSYSGYAPLRESPVRVYYFIPDGDVTQMPVLFVLHGASRNGADYRDAWTATAKAYKAIIVAPEFSDNFYPGGSSYNLGNVFINGNRPSASTLNPRDQWTFSILEPLFDEIKLRTGNRADTYDIYGHSAGAQFAHRFVMFEPEARAARVIAASSGWYTVPDREVHFPYGIAESPVSLISPHDYFSRALILQIGENDNNPDSAGLRHNTELDAQQGTNRYERALYFFRISDRIATGLGSPFAWKLDIVPGAGHDFRQAIPSAARILYGDR